MSDFIKRQFLDIIEYEADNPKILIWKFRRPGDKNDIMQGSKVVVRENQIAFFIAKGKLCDVIEPGTTTLTTGNFPLLSSLNAFPFRLSSPIVCEVYFLKLNQFFGNKWATKAPVVRKDPEVGVLRVRGFGNFSFRVSDPLKFMKSVFSAEGLTYSYDIVEFLKSLVAEAFSVAVSVAETSIFSLTSQTIQFSNVVEQIANERARDYGIEFPNVVIEGISLPDRVENIIDEQTGIGLAAQQNVHINTAAKLSKLDEAPIIEATVERIIPTEEPKSLPPQSLPISTPVSVQKTSENRTKNDALKLIKDLLDQSILTEEEFKSEKEKILQSDIPWI